MQVAKIQLSKNVLNPLRGQEKQQLTEGWTEARKNKLCMSESRFKQTVFRACSIFKENTAFARERGINLGATDYWDPDLCQARC